MNPSSSPDCGHRSGGTSQGAAVRCIPEQPEFGEGQSAERAVWEALRNSLPDDCVLAHSVQVRDGRAEHEIDLLVLWPGVGMAACGYACGGLLEPPRRTKCPGVGDEESAGVDGVTSVVADEGSGHAFGEYGRLPVSLDR